MRADYTIAFVSNKSTREEDIGSCLNFARALEVAKKKVEETNRSVGIWDERGEIIGLIGNEALREQSSHLYTKLKIIRLVDPDSEEYKAIHAALQDTKALRSDWQRVGDEIRGVLGMDKQGR